MDYDKLIEQLYQHNEDYEEGRTQNFLRVCQDCKFAAETIETLLAENYILRKMQPVELSGDAATSFALAQEVSRLRAELENEHAHRIHAEQHADAFLRDCEQLNAELERVKEEIKKVIKCKNCVHMWAVSALPGECYCRMIGEVVPFDGFCHKGEAALKAREQDEH